MNKNRAAEVRRRAFQQRWAAAVHAIRLRGPWEFEPLERFGDGKHETLPPGGRVQMPSDWADTLGSDFRGRVRYTRRFGRPTGAAIDQVIWLVFDEIVGAAEIRLDGAPLATTAGGSLRCDVTNRLAERNLLEIEITQPLDAAEPGGIPGELRLEIV